jgi:S-layer protein (TIGR01567 family)
MKQIMAILAIILISVIPVTAVNVTKFEIHGVVFDESSNKYNTTLLWDAQNFTGFWYSFGSGKSTETLKIDQDASSLKTGSRIINEEKLLYNTARSDQKYVAFSDKGKLVKNALEYNSTNKVFTRNTTGGYYARLGWFGDVYVAVNGNANKLAKLIKEQKKEEKQTLKLGETWTLGEGYNLTLESIDTSTSPRQAWLNLAKDGKTLDIKVVNEGEVYTYTEKILSGESSVPLFVTYVDSIFSDKSSFVQLKYTWLISNNVLEIKTGDKFGVFEVKEATENSLALYNKDIPINLAQNSVQTLYGDLKFKVADSAAALRFYPTLEKTKPGNYELRGGAYDQDKYQTLIWDEQRFPGFWYSSGAGKSTESLFVDQSASTLTNTNRTIEVEKLIYNTSRSDQKYKVFTEKGLKVENALEYNSTTKTFINSNNGSYYARLGWFGELYVAVNGKANKLAKIIKDQDKQEKQTLKLGTTWNLGEGFNLTVDALDVRTNPRQASLSLTKDGITLENKVVNEGEVYTYTEKNLKGESSVPVFVTYVESIFSGAKDQEIFVQLRYTWLISRNVVEIKTQDKFGVLEVKESNENYVALHNKENINLAQNTVIDLGNGLKFKVADSSTALRFYPYFEQVIQDVPKVDLKSATANATTESVEYTASTIASQTVTTTPSTSLKEASSDTGLAASSPVKTPHDTAKSQQWNWIFFAAAGLVATGYLVVRK